MAKQQLKTGSSPSFNEDEQSLIIADLLALKKEQIGEFLAGCNLPRSGTKEQLRARIEDALEDESLALDQIVHFLDSVIPWGKQHIYLFTGPDEDISDWRKTDWVSQLLKQHRMGKYLNAQLPLVLPEKMKVSSILHDSNRLRITATNAGTGGNVTQTMTNRPRRKRATRSSYGRSCIASPAALLPSNGIWSPTSPRCRFPSCRRDSTTPTCVPSFSS